MNNKMDLCCKGKTHKMEKFMEVYLLLLLYKEVTHGYALAEELTHFGFSKEEFNIGTLYRTLRKMEKASLVTSFWEKGAQGPRKRVYTISDKGKEELTVWIQTLKNRKKRIEKLINSYDSLNNQGCGEE
ncbi:MAG: PadR family transcriptional regulator [Elusimicrobiota bacterium]